MQRVTDGENRQGPAGSERAAGAGGPAGAGFGEAPQAGLSGHPLALDEWRVRLRDPLDSPPVGSSDDAVALPLAFREERLLHAGDTTLVRGRIPSNWNGAIVASFDEAGKRGTTGAMGFGERFLLKRGYGVCAFRCTTSSWYHWVDEGVLRRARGWMETAGAERRIGYGSSMGGYGAIRFAKALELDRVVAFAPQASLVASFERRWRAELRRAGAHYPVVPSDRSEGTAYEAYFDPTHGPDARQVELLRAALGDALRPIPLRYAGHRIADALLQAGLLKGAIRAPITPTQWSERRRRSWNYLLRLADGAIKPPHRHPRVAEVLSQKALELDPKNVEALRTLGSALLQQERPSEAIVAFEEALHLKPQHTRVMYQLAQATRRAANERFRTLSLTALELLDPDDALAASIRRANGLSEENSG